jgi:hypothetical protein
MKTDSSQSVPKYRKVQKIVFFFFLSTIRENFPLSLNFFILPIVECAERPQRSPQYVHTKCLFSLVFLNIFLLLSRLRGTRGRLECCHPHCSLIINFIMCQEEKVFEHFWRLLRKKAWHYLNA